MAIDSKGSAPFSSLTRDGNSRRRMPTPWWLAAVAVIVTVATLYRLSPDSALSSILPAFDHRGQGEHGSRQPQCPQVQPLRPTNSDVTPEVSAALAAMDVALRSPAYFNASAARLSGAVRVATPSFDDMGPVESDPRWQPMADFAAFLARTFPRTHDAKGPVQLEKVNTFALLYTWPGSDAALKPTVLMAHMDVVPVAEATVAQWTHPPWSGAFDGSYVWGRGASDCKNTLVGILEAVEALLAAGWTPRRTLVLAFGFDEEVSGPLGAGHLAPVLVERYGKSGGAAVIVDEGAGAARAWGTTFAAPGVAEKGYIDVDVVVRMPGGHSSIPPPHSGIGVAAELIALIEANPYQPHFHAGNPFLDLLRCGAAHSPEFPDKLRKLLPGAEARLRRLERTRPHHCGGGGEDDAEIHDPLALEVAKLGDVVKYLFTTSLAVDVVRGGVKVNALPERTVVTVNHRVNVGDTTQVVRDKLASLAAKVADKHNLTLNAFPHEDDDEGAELDEPPSSITLRADFRHTLEPSPLTPSAVKPEGSGDDDDKATTPWAVLSGTTRALYGTELVVAPALMTGNTDTRHYWGLTRHIFRLSPGLDPEEAEVGGGGLANGVHTVNERVSMLGHVNGVQWFSMFVRNMDEAVLE